MNVGSWLRRFLDALKPLTDISDIEGAAANAAQMKASAADGLRRAVNETLKERDRRRG